MIDAAPLGLAGEESPVKKGAAPLDPSNTCPFFPTGIEVMVPVALPICTALLVVAFAESKPGALEVTTPFPSPLKERDPVKERFCERPIVTVLPAPWVVTLGEPYTFNTP